jgi:uncharacterized membrane protein YqjE
VTEDTATRQQQRLVVGLAIVFAVLGGMFLTAAAVVVWTTTPPCGSRP